MNQLREGLPALPPHMLDLKIDERGYPIPYFVAYIKGKPDFRVADQAAVKKCALFSRCWVCGNPLGGTAVYVSGPLSGVTRTSGEPPSHHDCATFAARACPFLALPKARRREETYPEETTLPGGIFISRNPGVAMLWNTTSKLYLLRNAAGVVFRMPEPFKVEWYCEGRLATREEVDASLESGLHELVRVSKEDDARNHSTHAMDSLKADLERLTRWLP